MFGGYQQPQANPAWGQVGNWFVDYLNRPEAKAPLDQTTSQNQFDYQTGGQPKDAAGPAAQAAKSALIGAGAKAVGLGGGAGGLSGLIGSI